MLELKGKTGVIISGEVIFCKRGEHNEVIISSVEKMNIDDEDKFIEENVLLFDGDDLYTMNFTSISDTSNKNLKLIRNSDFSEWVAYLDEEE